MPKSSVIRVAFRIDRSGAHKQVTAVLPDLEANPGHRVCYAHVGQHGECSWGWYYSTRRATPTQYASLLQELQSLYETDGVQLRAVKRIQR